MNASEEVGDTRSILGDADTMSSRGTSITSSHMSGVLLVGNRDKLDASTGTRPEIKSVHEGRSVGNSNTMDNRLLLSQIDKLI